MKRQITLLMTLIAGIGIGAAAVQGLHAQAKPKAYVVAEYEVVDNAALAAYIPVARPLGRAAGERTLYTTGGRIVAGVGEPPKRVTIIEWDSIEQAQAYYNSPEYTNRVPQQQKALRYTRAYFVEATQ
jgi:uncharacterized protein (DUF1330 family)